MYLRSTRTAPERTRLIPGGARKAFTLIEIVVVIAIIAVLVGLLLAAVAQVSQAGARTANFTEIAQIGDAIGAAKRGLNLQQIPPGPFVLKSQYTGNEPEIQWLAQAWPQAYVGSNGPWTGTGSGLPNVTLDSNQTLLFFLTGSIVTNFNGFSTNPGRPFDPGNPGDTRKGPFFQVTNKYYSTTPGNLSQGIVVVSTSGEVQTTAKPNGQNLACQAITDAHVFPWLIDPYGMPYAYFAAYNGKSNLYCAPPHVDANATTPPNLNPNAVQSYTVTVTVHGVAGTMTVSPYTDASGNFINPQGFQIISAGYDSRFGAGGGILSAGTSNPHGQDDQANFSKSLLGGGIN